MDFSIGADHQIRFQ